MKQFFIILAVLVGLASPAAGQEAPVKEDIQLLGQIEALIKARGEDQKVIAELKAAIGKLQTAMSDSEKTTEQAKENLKARCAQLDLKLDRAEINVNGQVTVICR